MDARRPRLLIPDNTPLSLLSMMGKEALDGLFELGAEVWVTDMVRLKKEAKTFYDLVLGLIDHRAHFPVAHLDSE